jgi:hypothetical protein
MDNRISLTGGPPPDVIEALRRLASLVMRWERIRHQLYDDSEWTADEMRIQLARTAKDHRWDEPGMDAYDRYDEELRKRRQ